MNDLVSVIIPVYNVKDYLEDCIESVLNQNYNNLQIVLVDDGSTDGSGKMCDEYAEKDGRIQVIHQKNGGLSDARNTGLKNSHGEYIYFLDSDDRILPFAIEAALSKIKCTNSDFIFFDADIFGGNSLPKDYYYRKEVYNTGKGTDILNRLTKYNEYRSCVPMLFIKKSFLTKNNMSFEKGILYEDELFTLMLYCFSEKVSHLPLRLYQRRLRADSIITSHTTFKNFSSIIYVVKKILEFCECKNQLKEAYVSKNLERLCRGAYIKFEALSSADKHKAKNDMYYLKSVCKKMNYFGSKYIRLSAYPNLLGFLKFINRLVSKTNIKKTVFKIIKKLKGEKKAGSFPYTKSSKNSVWVIGTPVHGNLGDHAIALAEMDLLKDCLPQYNINEILMPAYHAHKKELKKTVISGDIIVVSGGGWLGTLWLHNEIVVRELIKTYKNNTIIVMPQTVYYEDSDFGKTELAISQKIYCTHPDLHFCLRDKKSYDFVIKNSLVSDRNNCYYMPDVALTLDYSKTSNERSGVLICFRQDKEQNMSEQDRWQLEKIISALNHNLSYTTTVGLDNISAQSRKDKLNQKFEEYSSAKLVITDRLHSMIFAVITKTPCIAVDNKTKKVSGVYEWIKDLDYIKVVETSEQAGELISYMINMTNNSYNIEVFSEKICKMLETVVGGTINGQD